MTLAPVGVAFLHILLRLVQVALWLGQNLWFGVLSSIISVGGVEIHLLHVNMAFEIWLRIHYVKP